MTILSDAEIAACRADGMVVPEFRLPPDELAHLQSPAARLIAGNRRRALRDMTRIALQGNA